MLLTDKLQREITPLTDGDCYMVFDRTKNVFDFPIHYHPEYELNFIKNGKGTRRIIGDHMSYIDNIELVLTGPNLYHGWEQGNCSNKNIHEITIQFHQDLFQADLLKRNAMRPIKELMEKSVNGVLFSKEIAIQIEPDLINLAQKNSVDSFIALLNVLYKLANPEHQTALSSEHSQFNFANKNEQIKKVYLFIEQNFHKKIRIEEIANQLNMTVITFGRFMKKNTGKTFVEFINNFRIGYATRLLIETNLTVSEIAFRCGFNNQSHFNRIFKRLKSCNPTSYKSAFEGIKRVI